VLMSLWSFQGARGPEPTVEKAGPLAPGTGRFGRRPGDRTSVSQNSTACRRGRRCSRRAVSSDDSWTSPRGINKQ